MIKIIARRVLLFALLAPSAFAAPAPPVSKGRLAEYETSARVIGRAGRLEPLLDLTGRWQFAGQRPYRALTLGTYGRLHPNLKLGLFYRVQHGARHDDDWINDGAGNWFWRPTTNRPENVIVVDATPRMSLSGNFTGTLKIRYEHNFFNGQRSLKLEPEVAWFWLDGLSPKATIFIKHGTYIPLNFGTRSYYERWWYLAGLWHPTKDVSMGPSIALRDVVWTTSSDYRAASGGGSYRVLYRALVWGANLVIRTR